VGGRRLDPSFAYADARDVAVSWRTVLLAAFLFQSEAPALADGGTLRLTRAAGPFVITIFTAPEPLRVGSAEVSVLVLERGAAGAVLLDATVELRVRAPDGTARMLVASHAAGSNRLLQAALLELPAPGTWQLTIAVRHESDTATVSLELPVGSAAPRLVAQWPPLALPPLCVLLFVWRERLLRHRARHGSFG
jgi:hypothetical protein